jgi:hypothetical protein
LAVASSSEEASEGNDDGKKKGGKGTDDTGGGENSNGEGKNSGESEDNGAKKGAGNQNESEKGSSTGDNTSAELPDATNETSRNADGHTRASQGIARAGGGLPAGNPAWETAFQTDRTNVDPLTNASIALSENASAIDHRQAVLSVLQNASENETRGSLLRRHAVALDGTFEYVLDGKRVTSAEVFRVDKQVVASLHARAPDVTEHLLYADEKVARQAIDDAERVAMVLDERNVTYDEDAVAANLTAAKDAFEQAEQVRERSQPGALEHYRQAWTHAQRALDVLDEATEPNVTIETREDLPHNESIEYTVAGTVFDVRPYELTAELTLNDSTRDLDMDAGTEPATEASFYATVMLETQTPDEPRVYEANVSARDPGVDVADQGSAVDDERSVALYRYNETTQTFDELNSSIDAGNDTVTANASSTGTYVAFDRENWNALFEDPLPPEWSFDGNFDNTSMWECEGKDGDDGDCQPTDGGIVVDGTPAAQSSGNLSILKDCVEPGNCIPPGQSGDSDGDGIIDYFDDCPYTYGEGSDGCPEDDDDSTDPFPGGKTTRSTYKATVDIPDAKEITLDAEISAWARDSDAQAYVRIESEGGSSEELFSLTGEDGEKVTDSKQITDRDFTDYARESITIVLRAKNDAELTVEYMYLTYDTDGDGLSDSIEKAGIRTGTGDTIPLDYTDEHSDDDNLTDGEEVGGFCSDRLEYADDCAYFLLNSDPSKTDTDEDGLDDETETDGWPIEPEAETVVSFHGNVTSEPMRVDTDFDGATDSVEFEQSTHPREDVTYDITNEHQEAVVDRLVGEWEDARTAGDGAEALKIRQSMISIGLLPSHWEVSDLANRDLTDGTDDFDFIRPDDGGLAFVALDGTTRTDTWFSNVEEARAGTDPWDPDTDDDGLTDGQEAKWITTVDGYPVDQ